MNRSFVLLCLLSHCTGQDLFLSAKELTRSEKKEPSDRDISRAKSTVPRAAYVASEPGHIATRLNTHLTKLAKNQVKVCASYTIDELLRTLETLWAFRSPQLSDHYASDDGRSHLHSETASFEAAWRSIGDEAAALSAACADVAKLFVHHLTEQGRDEVLKERDLSVPLLAAYDPAHAAKGKAYTKSLTCVVGHNMTKRTYDHNWPHWPAEAHYFGYGHGAYPFWAGPGSGTGTPDLEVWYSQTRYAEKLYHNACGTSQLDGYSKDVPCYHMMLGAEPKPVAYLWTKGEDYCCKAETASSLLFPPGPSGGGGMSAPQADFMDTMTYQGTGHFSGHFYTGDVKKYTLKLPESEPVDWFFYYTTPDGHPVCQGEGAESPDGSANGQLGVGKGIFVWHEYNITSFQATTHTDATFAVPDVCKTTTHKCEFPN